MYAQANLSVLLQHSEELFYIAYFLKQYHIPSNLNATYRFPQQCEPKRAPDTITINQLDSFFFDNKVDIPLDYRAIYLLLRLHTHRFSEVAATPLDCISYPDDNVFAITIPNSKETPLHMPNYQKYNFLLQYICG